MQRRKSDPKISEYRLTAAIAEKRIRSLALTSDKVAWSHHALERMVEREILDVDVLRVLRTGTIAGEPELTPHGEWKCKMVRPIRGSREVGVITILLKTSRLLIKAVEWEDLA